MQGYWERAFTSQDIEEHAAGFGIQAGPSLVIDTPDRKIPYQAWALDFRRNIIERFISPLASCFPPGIPREIVAPAAHQIVQAPGYLMHLLEYRTRTGSFRSRTSRMRQAPSDSGRATHGATGKATRW